MGVLDHTWDASSNTVGAYQIVMRIVRQLGQTSLLIRQYDKSRFPLAGISWNFMLGICTKICLPNWNTVEIGKNNIYCMPRPTCADVTDFYKWDSLLCDVWGEAEHQIMVTNNNQGKLCFLWITD